MDNNKPNLVKIEKSKKYPRYNIETCIQFTKMLREKFGKRDVELETIYDSLKTRKSSTFKGKLASAKQFGLLKVSKGHINFTSLAEELLFPISEKTTDKALVDAFQSPPLYADLIQQFDGSQLPEMLSNILSRNHGIANSVKEDATKVFIDSARFAKVLDENGQLSVYDKISSPLTEDSKPEEEQDDITKVVTDVYVPKSSSKTFFQPILDDMQKIEIALFSGGRAYIYVPKKISSEDVELLELQIKFLKFQAELSKSGGTTEE